MFIFLNKDFVNIYMLIFCFSDEIELLTQY